MSVSERDRHQFYETARERLGEAEADFLMAMLPPVGWADVATKHDLSEVEGRLALRIAGVEGRVDALDGRMGRLERQMESFEAALRSATNRFTALLVGQTVAMITVVGLVAG